MPYCCHKRRKMSACRSLLFFSDCATEKRDIAVILSSLKESANEERNNYPVTGSTPFSGAHVGFDDIAQVVVAERSMAAPLGTLERIENHVRSYHFDPDEKLWIDPTWRAIFSSPKQEIHKSTAPISIAASGEKHGMQHLHQIHTTGDHHNSSTSSPTVN
mmetsp:Transcript_3840/g.5710  ORF Transcript_3840/g.5710 Transcript_3840/m.5710 type:complete len:160 (+) Transcript_3840:1-480(+)